MRVLLLNGFKQESEIGKKFSNLIVKSFDNRKNNHKVIEFALVNISKCNGCFSCWIKTPGECIVEDNSQNICKQIINSELLVLLTPVVYGGFSSSLKSMIDKTIPLITPFFKRYSGEVHHVPRYKKYPKILGIGIQSYPSEDESNCFKQIISRNSLNFHSPCSQSITLLNSDNNNYIESRLFEIVSSMEKE